MDYKAYSAEIESRFQRSEYITISHLSVKMLTLPRVQLDNDCQVFCFLIHGAAPCPELCERFAKYAMSIAFYSGKDAKGDIISIPLFICDNASENDIQSISKCSKKTGGAFSFPLIFNLSENKLIHCKKRPISKAKLFSALCDFANKSFCI